MALVKVRGKGQITLPAEIRERLGIEESDLLEARIEGRHVVLVPQVVVPKFGAVDLSSQGERMVDEALEDVGEGRVREYEDAEALIEDLHHETAGD